MRQLSQLVVLAGLVVALASVPLQAFADQNPAGTKRNVKRSGHTARSVAPSGPLSIADTAAIASRWGIRIDTLRLTAAGYMLDFRYHVLDANKAMPLFERKTKPVLLDEASGVRLPVPVPPKTGALRSSNEPQAGRNYFMFFANPARFIKPGKTVTVTIGEFSVSGIQVDTESAAKGAATSEQHHHPAAASEAARVVAPTPAIGDIPLVDSENRATSLREALAHDGPVFVNFIFTSCTTICPVMTAAFAQLHRALAADRENARLVSISIDPEVDTVATLAAYANRYHAGESWRFLTGSLASVEAAQRAFGAYRGDKNNHTPATYFRRGPTAPWQAVTGLSSAEALLALSRGSAR